MGQMGWFVQTDNRSFRYEVVSIQVDSIQTQAVKLHKKFYSLQVYKVCQRTRKTFWVNNFVPEAKYVELFKPRMN